MGWVLCWRTEQITVLMVGFIAVKENQAQSGKGEDTWGEVRGVGTGSEGLRRCQVAYFKLESLEELLTSERVLDLSFPARSKP